MQENVHTHTLTFVFPNTHDGIRYRVIESHNVRFVNLQGQFYSAASSMVFEVHDGGAVSAPAGDWPSVWFRTPDL